MDWARKQNKREEKADMLTPGEQLPSKATLNYSSDDSKTAELKYWNLEIKALLKSVGIL